MLSATVEKYSLAICNGWAFNLLSTINEDGAFSA